MSGHSKWHNIQAKKGKMDAKKGKVFTKIGREIAIAAKGGSSIESNARLANVVAKAKAANMPLENIQRAIKKGAGELENVNYEEIIYEGYGPSGVAVIATALTDNKNRTAGNVRSSFTKCGGNLGTSGCVSFMFQTKGQLVIERTDDMDEDEFMMLALDAGAEDFEAQEEVFQVTTSPEDFNAVREALEKEGFEFLEAEIAMIPDTYTAINESDAALMQKLIDKLEDDDDVQDVYHNAEFPEGWEE